MNIEDTNKHPESGGIAGVMQSLHEIHNTILAIVAMTLLLTSVLLRNDSSETASPLVANPVAFALILLTR